MSTPPQVLLTATPLRGETPLDVVIEYNGTPAATAARYTTWWGDGNSNAATSATSGSHNYTEAGTYVIRVQVRDNSTGLFGFDDISIQAYRVAPSGAAEPPEGEVSTWEEARPVDPSQPAFQTRRKSRAVA